MREDGPVWRLRFLIGSQSFGSSPDAIATRREPGQRSNIWANEDSSTGSYFSLGLDRNELRPGGWVGWPGRATPIKHESSNKQILRFAQDDRRSLRMTGVRSG